MSEVRSWLEAIRLALYADAFEADEIDMDLLGHVDDQIIKGIGVSAANAAEIVFLRARRRSPSFCFAARPGD